MIMRRILLILATCSDTSFVPAAQMAPQPRVIVTTSTAGGDIIDISTVNGIVTTSGGVVVAGGGGGGGLAPTLTAQRIVDTAYLSAEQKRTLELVP